MPSQIPFKFDVPSVTQLTTEIKQVLESKFTDVLVEGELSNVNRSRNGHLYFTVKDQGAQMPCVMWRSTVERTHAELSDGKQVILGGSIQVYAPHGRYQMIVTLVEQAGIGRLQQAFEQLKQKLQDKRLRIFMANSLATSKDRSKESRKNKATSLDNLELRKQLPQYLVPRRN